MSITSEIRDRAKSITGNDTESLLKKMHKEFTSLQKQQLALMKKGDVRDRVLFKMATIGDNSKNNGLASPVFSTKSTTNVNQNIQKALVNKGSSINSSIAIKNDSNMGAIAIKDVKGEAAIDKLNDEVTKQTGVIADSGTKVFTLLKASAIRAVAGNLFTRAEEFIEGPRDNLEIIHGLREVVRAIKGEDPIKYDARSGLSKLIAQYTDGAEIDVSKMGEMAAKGKVAIGGLFDMVQGVFGTEKTAEMKKKFFSYGETAATGVNGIFEDLKSAVSNGDGAVDSAKNVGGVLKTTVTDALKKVMGSKPVKTGLFNLFAFGATGVEAKVVSQAFKRPMGSFKLAAAAFTTTIGELVNRPLHQTAAVMYEMAGVKGIAFALFMKSFKIFTFDIFSIFKKDGFVLKNVIKGWNKLSDYLTDKKKSLFGSSFIKKMKGGLKKAKKKIGFWLNGFGIWLGVMGSKAIIMGSTIMTAITGTLMAALPFIIATALGAAALGAGLWIGNKINETWGQEIADGIDHMINQVGNIVEAAMVTWDVYVVMPLTNMIDNVVSSVKSKIEALKDFFSDPIGYILNKINGGGDTITTPNSPAIAELSKDSNSLSRGDANNQQQQKLLDRLADKIDKSLTNNKTEVMLPPTSMVENYHTFRLVQDNN